MSASIEQLTEVSVLTDLAQECGLEYGRAVAQRFPVDGGWRERTFSEVAAATYRVARLLRSAGVRPGDRVALLCATRAEWTICDLAITRLGAVCVPVYPTSSIDQIAWVLQDSGASAVIAETSEHVATVERLRPSSPDLRVVDRKSVV